MLAFYDNIMLVACIGLCVLWIGYHIVKRFIRERKLKRLEIIAELNILLEKNKTEEK
ncbi:hypothetical protein P6P90_04700 [Ectobacillus antri]|jgi:hypothetical protein|uniref:DUF4083 domain-containing protein n=1 Tax=Ectobacillus antri TaxID=2486280 RepID=A0ABT6H3X4_9BACI|nr:hypothetical protein [Ectobacillus antri]MDG4655539.1 hypothetical protein [Ectobacillus antri]MDG5753297.1 hypothetical protein [Ectobacillus antri]